MIEALSIFIIFTIKCLLKNDIAVVLEIFLLILTNLLENKKNYKKGDLETLDLNTSHSFVTAEEHSMAKKAMLIYLFFGLVYPYCDFIMKLLEHYLSNKIYYLSSSYDFKKVLEYKYTNIFSAFKSDIYSQVVRRAKGISSFYNSLISTTLSSLIYFVIALIGAKYILQNSNVSTIFIYLFFIPLPISVMPFIRNYAGKKLNSAFNITETKIKDIFVNFEMIQLYGTKKKEIQEYSASLDNFIFWFKTYWLLHDILNLSVDCCKILLKFKVFSFLKERIIFEKDFLKLFSSLDGVASKNLKMFKNFKDLVENYDLVAISELNVFHRNTDSNKTPKNKKVISSFSEIRVQGLSKSYGDICVFDKANLILKENEAIAITGPNGAGKSKFTMILAMLEEYEGDIFLDNMNIKDIGRETFKSLITFTPQDSKLFDGTIMDNITCFDDTISQEDVFQLATKFGFMDELRAIGFNTVVIDNQSSFSQSFKQKVCLLRTLIRDTPIYIFDESTSRTSLSEEKELVGKIMEHCKGKTVIMIIHNFSLLEVFDKVIFVSDKTIHTPGNINDLLASNQRFKEYYCRNNHPATP